MGQYRQCTSVQLIKDMAKSRIINTRFWIDDYISNLDPIEKLLFLYFLTNPATDICGVYELPLKNIALDTGIDKEMAIKVLDRFTRDGKIIYHKGWVIIKNFIKHQSINPAVKKGIEASLEKIPLEIRELLNDREPIESLSEPSDRVSDIKSNLIKSNLIELDTEPLTPSEEALDFFSGGESFSLILADFVEKTSVSPPLLEKEFKKFILYWTEKNKSGTKQKWQLEPTFEVKRRLANWLGRMKDFNKIQESRIIT